MNDREKNRLYTFIIVFVVDINVVGSTFKGKKRLINYIQKRAFAVRPQKWLLLQGV
jgi:hypothetical protein